MHDSVTSALGGWSNFYVMTGSSAAGLTGLMFVVITLVIDRQRRGTEAGLSTFSTPTVAHFSAALLVSAILSAPWHHLIGISVLLAILGICGVAYVAQNMYRTRQLSEYRADLEDWIWFNIIPFVSYGAILLGAITLVLLPRQALFAIATGVVVLIFLGIRNAWDIVTFIAMGKLDEPDPPKPSDTTLSP